MTNIWLLVWLSHYVQNFTAKHIQDMLSIKEVVDDGLLHFENMGGHVVHGLD